MALSNDETSVFTELKNTIELAALEDERRDRYYEGQQRLEHIGLAVPPELRRFETVVNWPRLAVDAVEERLDVEGFRLPGEDQADDNLWRIWQFNNLDEESQLAHLDALIYGRSFVCVGANADDTSSPLVTVESPRQMVAAIDPRTRTVSAALRLYGATDLDPEPKLATLYQPDSTTWLRLDAGRWVEYDRDDHKLGMVPVVPIINRRRTGNWSGVSEMADVIPMTDAAARALTNLQIAAETHSVPQKWVLGMSRGDFVDASGDPIPAWQSYFSAIWANQNADAKVGQFTASSLSNFHDTVNHYAQLVAAVTGLPPHYLGWTTDNPASADAIRSSESRLVKRAERKQRVFGGAWETAMRTVLMFAGIDLGPEAFGMEAIWRDPATPTVAAQADAAVKLKAAGVLSREGTWDQLGWSQARKDRERDYFDREASDPLIAQILNPPQIPPAGPSGLPPLGA